MAAAMTRCSQCRRPTPLGWNPCKACLLRNLQREAQQHNESVVRTLFQEKAVAK